MPPWRIDLTERPRVPRVLPMSRLARVVAAALQAAEAPTPGSIGLILSDDRELAALNQKHMGHRAPTDVLSFPLLELAPGRRWDRSSAPGLPPQRRVNLGDIVISVERAIEQAEQGRGGQTGDVGWSAADELRLLVVHGALHVCGWDHAEKEEEAAMRALERRILAMADR